MLIAADGNLLFIIVGLAVGVLFGAMASRLGIFDKIPLLAKFLGNKPTLNE